MDLKLQSLPNDVGTDQDLESVNDAINALAQHWEDFTGSVEKSWWQFWKRGKTTLFSVTKFLLFSLDNLIQFVDDLIKGGPDKKATVMAAVEKLYDYVIKEAMPIWLKPFSGAIRKFILNVIVSTSIDWIVSKYREGSWQKSELEFLKVKKA